MMPFFVSSDDELKEENLFKNLYRANNFEQFRRQTELGTPSDMFPKVIVTTRSELLMRDTEYGKYFLPLETDNTQSKNALFVEMRIAPFEEKVQPYIHALVALELRVAFTARVGSVKSLSTDAVRELGKNKEIHSLAAMKDALLAPGRHEQKWDANEGNTLTKNSSDRWQLDETGRTAQSRTLEDSLAPLVHLLVRACTNDVSSEQIDSFIRYVESSGDAIWRFEQYFDAFKAIPGARLLLQRSPCS